MVRRLRIRGHGVFPGPRRLGALRPAWRGPARHTNPSPPECLGALWNSALAWTEAPLSGARDRSAARIDRSRGIRSIDYVVSLRLGTGAGRVFQGAAPK